MRELGRTSLVFALVLVSVAVFDGAALAAQGVVPRSLDARLAFDDRCRLMELSLSGGEVGERKLANRACWWATLWAPDRTRIAVARDTQPMTIEILSADGAHEATLGDTLGVDAVYLRPTSWRPDDLALVVSVGTSCGIKCANDHPYLLTTDGAPPVELSGYPLWSPDGSTMLREKDEKESRSCCGLEVADARGEGGRDLAPEMSQMRDPAWSPDGRSVAFVGPPEDGSLYPEAGNLSVVALDGSPPRQVSREGVHGHGPVWSPDGSAIAWLIDPSPSDGAAVQVIDVASGAVTALPRTAIGHHVNELAWSPDGQHLLVAGSDGRGSRGKVVMAPADGSRGWHRSGDHASWSPDGRWIAIMDTARGIGRVVLMSVDGGPPHEIHAGTNTDTAPVWLP